MAKSKGKTRLAKVQAGVQEAVEAIDEKIDAYEMYLKPYEDIKTEIDKLKAARRALLGRGNVATGSGGTQIRQADIIEYLGEHPGHTPGQIAEKLGVKQPTISSHLQRGKDERFLTDGNSHWWLRDPKVGINTYQDIVDADTEED